MTIFILVSFLLLAIVAPYIALRAVAYAKKGEYQTHLRIQKILFWVFVAALVFFELYLRFLGGSGSLSEKSSLAHTTFFKVFLTAHIVGAVLTLIIWAINVFMAQRNFKRSILPGSLSRMHTILGYTTIVGLFYIAATAIGVFLMLFL